MSIIPSIIVPIIEFRIESQLGTCSFKRPSHVFLFFTCPSPALVHQILHVFGPINVVIVVFVQFRTGESNDKYYYRESYKFVV